MVMLRPSDKAQKIAEKVLKQKGIKVPKSKAYEKTKLQTPYLQHQEFMKKKETAKAKKMHEAKAGRMYNESKKHEEREEKSMKKILKKMPRGR